MPSPFSYRRARATSADDAQDQAALALQADRAGFAAIGTAGIGLPLRDPLTIAKQATSLDHLTGNRFLLGLSTGDRQVEYPAFGVAFNNRAERFRDAHSMLRAVTEGAFPRHRDRRTMAGSMVALT